MAREDRDYGRGRERSLKGKEKDKKYKRRESVSPRRTTKPSKDRGRVKDRKKSKKFGSSSSDSYSSSGSSRSSSSSSSASSSSYSSSSSSSDSRSSSSGSSYSSSDHDRRKRRPIPKRARDVARRQSKENKISGDEHKEKIVEIEIKNDSHRDYKSINRASPPRLEDESKKPEGGHDRFQKEKELADKSRDVDVGRERGDFQEKRKELPRSYQKDIERRPSPPSASSSDESDRAKSPVQKQVVPSPRRSSSRSKSREAVFRSRSPRRRKRSTSPVAMKIHVGNLTRNVTKDHLVEIFSNYGKVLHADIPINRSNYFQRNHAYVEFAESEDAEKAVKHMDGAWIDGQEVQTKLVLPMRDRRRSPPPRFGGGQRRRSPPRYRQPYRGGNRRSHSPPPRRRSRSPFNRGYRRRRGSTSSGSSRSPQPARRGVNRARSKSPSVSRRRRFSGSSSSS